ncbi:MAG: SDR family oxidoreductase [Hymenobacteraceae bacterium]|nr:SDR family oxidoreductase [Hymenobacteraceae bacterium]MDX5396150.1 SDR family oxidoreductase [Hymenobacteraceae bacterium]MDX5443850.1 SDR family oxidoreductase [Hymenobacteraceae bacterium]MDX5512211.1 SDR family oxidoreductase [Hymenobacteraceae bacterium]
MKQISDPPPSQYVLITGASSGIGYELTLLFAKDRNNLILVARSEAKLRQIAKKLASEYAIDVRVVAADLAEPRAADHVFDDVQGAGLTVDVLVNNAGFGDYGSFRHAKLQKQLDMIQVNVTALTHLSKLFLDQLPPERQGRILNVASVAGFQPGPLMAVYYASKAYVLSFSEALANELKNTNVTVTVLCPGQTETDFERRANLHESKLFKGKISSAKIVAAKGYDALMAGKVIEIPGVKNKLSTFAVRLFPRKIVRSLVRLIQEKR